MNKRVNLIMSIALATIFASAALAEDSPLDEGIKEYTAGRYSDALNHLGSALNSEFNNSKLHYYMGSCYMKLNKKEAAVREFRIAYALEPAGAAGQYSKQALASLGVEGSPPGAPTSTPSSPSSEIFSKGLQDQRALGKAIADYDRQRAMSGYMPSPGYSQSVNQGSLPSANQQYYQPVNNQSYPPASQRYFPLGQSNSQGYGRPYNMSQW